MDQRMARGFKLSPYYLAMCMLAEALGVELDDVRYHREVALADESFESRREPSRRGPSAAIKFGFDGDVHGTPRIVFEWVWRVTDDVAPEWPTGTSRWIVRIDGDPTVEAALDLATTFDAGRAVSLTVATIVLNAVPAVCAAPPGLYNNLTIGLHGGGYFAE